MNKQQLKEQFLELWDKQSPAQQIETFVYSLLKEGKVRIVGEDVPIRNVRQIIHWPNPKPVAVEYDIDRGGIPTTIHIDASRLRDFNVATLESAAGDEAAALL